MRNQIEFWNLVVFTHDDSVKTELKRRERIVYDKQPSAEYVCVRFIFYFICLIIIVFRC